MEGRQATEDKPLEKTFFDENLQRYCINFSEYGDYYNFYDSPELVSDCLKVFENVFVLQPNLRQVHFKCLFTTINPQSAPRTGFVETTDNKCL